MVVKTQNRILVISASIVLASCAQAVWVKPGATSADFEVTKGHCLAAAYSQVPAAPSVATLGSGYQSPLVTNCSGFGNSASCITTGGQYTPPVSVPYDANAGVRNEVFRGCMYGEGWSLQRRDADATVVANDSDWTKGLKWGVKNGEGAACDMPPKDMVKPDDWMLGCRSGQAGA
jgi:hypothetical protein